MPGPKKSNYNRPTYSPEYRRQLVELVRSGRKPSELAKEFGVHEGTIRTWVHQAKSMRAAAAVVS